MSIVSLKSLKCILLIGILAFTLRPGFANPEREENISPIYVDASASGNSSGSSWENAFTNLQDAFTLAKNQEGIISIFVAEGVYTSTASDPLILPSNIQMYGGFRGDETDTDQRQLQTYQTVLTSSNTDHILIGENLSEVPRIDGFHFENGVANGSGIDRHGAAIYLSQAVGQVGVSSSIVNCVFTNNSTPNGDGGAIFLQNTSVSIVNSEFITNEARGDGGAICIKGNFADVKLLNVLFSQNRSTVEEGGAIAVFGSKLLVQNGIFFQNSAKQGGGIFAGKNNSTRIVHSAFYQNSILSNEIAPGSAIRIRGIGEVQNSIFWKNEDSDAISTDGQLSVSYSIVEGGYTGLSNLDADPLFILPSSLNFRVEPGSPAIDMGIVSSLISPLDFEGKPRELGQARDIGPYEFDPLSLNPPTILYVDESSSGLNNGLSWGDAFNDLQDALRTARNTESVQEIWVASGTYKPTQIARRSDAFILVNDVDLLGGFAGNEEDKEERDPSTHKTYLSGEINDVSDFNNSWHVLEAENISSPTLFDGFYIQNGFGFTSGNDRHGAGLIILNSQNLRVTRCEFSNNTSENGDGGAVYISGSHNLTFQTTTFKGNEAKGDGGAIYIDTESYAISVERSVFDDNKSTEEDGGAIAIFGGASMGKNLISNSQFTANESQRGGAIYLARNGAVEIENVTFAENTAPSQIGSAINARGELELFNSILWSNSDQEPLIIEENERAKIISYSIIEGGFAGEQILDADPLFVNPASGDYTLSPTSPAIDRGKATSDQLDLAGNLRVSGEQVDLGAYEFIQTGCFSPSRLYVDIDATGLEDGSSWENAYTDLQNALAAARSCELVKEIWVAEGIYLPSQTANPDDIFELVSGVSLYGGFVGNEADASQRDWKTYKTLLSGFLDCEATPFNCDARSDVVVIGEDLAEGTIFDGFTITGGANGLFVSSNLHGSSGAGMILTTTGPDKVCKPTIQHCRFEDNDAIYGDGGGLYVFQASPTIKDCEFISNFADGDGAGLFLLGDEDMKVINCSFMRNSCYFDGGGIASYLPNLEVENCVFFSNYAELDGGGGISTGFDSDLIVRNSTFHFNRVDEGDGGALRCGGSTTVYNSIFWQNGHLFVDEDFNDIGFSCSTGQLAINNSIVEFGYPGIGNMDIYPEFVDEEFGDLRLRANSPAIDGGDSSFSTLSLDLAGNQRVLGNEVDMGAYEFGTACNLPARLYVKKGSTGDGSSWSNAIPELSIALQLANECADVEEVWISADTYIAGEGAEELSLYGLNRMAPSFKIRGDLKLYGGFTGTESSLEDRGENSYSILKENLEPELIPSLRRKRVLIASRTTPSSLIDGLSIEEASGIGLYAVGLEDTTSSLAIQNCQFKGNYTAIDFALMSLKVGKSHFVANTRQAINYSYAITNRRISIDSSSFSQNKDVLFVLVGDSITISNSKFHENQASGQVFGTVSLSNSSFLNNTSPLSSSGGNNGSDYILRISTGESTINNSVFVGNQTKAGGVLSIGSVGNKVIANSTFFNNPQEESNRPGGSIIVDPYRDSLFIYNSILWSNLDTLDQEGEIAFGDFFGSTTDPNTYLLVSNSTVSNGWTGPGENNLDLYPEFNDTSFTSLDLSLMSSSPAIDAGSSEFVIGSTDLAGLPRVVGNEVDMGAYEFQDNIIPTVTRFLLIDADTDLAIEEITDGSIINYNSLGGINMEAQTQGEVGSVKFELNGPISIKRTENRPPWALFGDNNGDYRAWTLFPGVYTLKATPYELAGAVGESGTAKEITFEVFGVDASVRDNSYLVKVYPNPTTGTTTLSLPNYWHDESKLRLMDRLGNVVWTSAVSAGKRVNQLNFSHLADGVYLLQVKNGEQVESRKIVIAH